MSKKSCPMKTPCFLPAYPSKNPCSEGHIHCTNCGGIISRSAEIHKELCERAGVEEDASDCGESYVNLNALQYYLDEKYARDTYDNSVDVDDFYRAKEQWGEKYGYGNHGTIRASWQQEFWDATYAHIHERKHGDIVDWLLEPKAEESPQEEEETLYQRVQRINREIISRRR